MSSPFIGEIKMVGFTFAPRSWANCDGQLLPISQNTALFSLLGTTYGGDGRTTFALPDLRGRVPMHTGQGAGLTNRPMGQRSGAEAVALTAGNLPAHDHDAGSLAATTTVTVRGSSGDADATSPSSAALAVTREDTYLAATPDVDLAAGSATATTGLAGSTGQTGSGQSVDNMQPYQVVRFVIALQGIFPSRS
jgi:microcystin-dependent protein